MALVFANERIMNTDCSLQFFSSVNDRTFFFQESRYGVFPTQVPLILGVHMQLPMQWLVVIYSLSFPLVYGIMLWVVQHTLRSMTAALALAATLIIGWSSTFFHCTTETHLLLAASALLYATYEAFGQEAKHPARRAAPYLVVIWCLSIHPNALFTVGFVTGLAWINGRVTLRSGLISLAIAAAYTLAAMGMAERGSYDANQYQTLLNGLGRIAHIGDLGAVWFLKEWIGGQYLVPAIMAGVVIVFSGNWRSAGFMTVCVCVFLLITILTFPHGDSLAMMEKSYMPALFMIMLAFFTMLPKVRYPGLAIAFVCIGTVHALYNIQVAGLPYSQRLDTMRALLDGPGRHTPKMAIRKTPFEGTPMVENNWALSMDALIMSRCSGPSARTIFMDDEAERVLAEMPVDAQFLYTSWDPYGKVLKNRTYFNLPDGRYTLVAFP